VDKIKQRIALRAYHLWESEGRPHGQDQDHWERARFLTGIEDNPEAGTLPNPSIPTVQNPQGTAPVHPPAEPLREAVENLGEFPGLADQGENARAPVAPEPSEPAPRSRQPAK
jgi:hypothetical protein